VKLTHRHLLNGAIALGLCLRLYFYAVRPPTLWQDEAYWAVKAIKTAAIDAQIRPIGFMVVTQFLLRVFGPAASVFRILPGLGSFVSMALSGYVATRLFKQAWGQLLSVGLLAVNPVVLEMALEFKHYGTEVGVYMGVLAALLFHLERGTWKSLALLLATAWVSFFFSITIIFFYPAMFCVVAWRAYRSRDFRRLIAIGATAFVCLGTISTVYVTTWRTIKTQKAEKKWGTWYDVFYLKNGLRTSHDSRLSWTTAKYFELASTPSVDRDLWKSERLSPERLGRLKLADVVLWSALHLLGLAWLVRQRRLEELALLWTPLLMVTAFNLAGRWPAGAFRTNTFYVPFAILISCFALEWLPSESSNRRLLAYVATGLLWLSTVVFRPNLDVKGLWTKPGAFTEALDALPLKPRKNARMLVMDFESCRPWDYYTVYDRPYAKRGPELRQAYNTKCLRTGDKLEREFKRLMGSQAQFTYLITDPRKFTFMEELAQKRCAKQTATYFHGRTHLLLTCRP